MNIKKSLLSFEIYAKFLSEIEWSSWSDCYVVSKGKGLHQSYSMSARSRTMYSKCGIQKLSGRQYRTSRCMDNGFMEECINAGKEHKRQTKKCTPPCRKTFKDPNPPPRYLYEKDFVPEKTKDVTKLHHHSIQSEDYELVTSGDVEELQRRRSKKYYGVKGDTVDDKTSHLSNEVISNTKLHNKSRGRSNQVIHNHSSHINEIGESRKNLSDMSLTKMQDIRTKVGIEKPRGRVKK